MSLVHGTLSGYKYYGCRCDRCRKANTVACRKWMKEHPDALARKARNERIRRRGGDPDILLKKAAVHGEISGLRKHRRDGTRLCRKCRSFQTQARKEREAKHKAALRPHGTEAALRRHYDRGERPCARCRNVYKNRGKYKNRRKMYTEQS